MLPVRKPRRTWSARPGSSSGADSRTTDRSAGRCRRSTSAPACRRSTSAVGSHYRRPAPTRSSARRAGRPYGISRSVRSPANGPSGVSNTGSRPVVRSSTVIELSGDLGQRDSQARRSSPGRSAVSRSASSSTECTAVPNAAPSGSPAIGEGVASRSSASLTAGATGAPAAPVLVVFLGALGLTAHSPRLCRDSMRHRSQRRIGGTSPLQVERPSKGTSGQLSGRGLLGGLARCLAPVTDSMRTVGPNRADLSKGPSSTAYAASGSAALTGHRPQETLQGRCRRVVGGGPPGHDLTPGPGEGD